MASSGSLNTSAYKFSYGSRYLTLNWEVISQSIVNNETDVRWELVGAGDYQYGAVGSDFHIEIDGVVVYDKPYTYHVDVYKGTVIASGTTTIKHDTDGKKVFTAYVEAGIYVNRANVSGTGAWELPTIAQASDLDVSDGTLGTAQNLTVTRKSTDFTHTITYKCGAHSGTICTKSAAETISFTPPLELASENTAGLYVPVTFSVQTYNGDTEIGNAVTKTVSMYIPESVVPHFTLSVTDATGYKDGYGNFIKSLSKLKVDIVPELAYGAEIFSYSILANGSVYNTASVVTDALKTFGTMNIMATVIDSRGRLHSETVSIEIVDYTAPAISKISAVRCDADGSADPQGTHLKVIFTSAVTPLNNKNGAYYSWAYRKASVSAWEYSSEISDLRGAYVVKDHSLIFSAEAVPYVIQVAVNDNFNNTARLTDGPASFYLIAPHASGRGLGLGMMPVHEVGLDVGFPLYAYDDILLEPGKRIIVKQADGNWGVELRGDGEGGNIAIYPPRGNGSDVNLWEIDAHDGGLRFYSLENNGAYTNPLTMTKYGVLINGLCIGAKSWLDAIYPVNSIYISYSHESPASLFGGTWTRMENTFLWGCLDGNDIGAQGGTYAEALTTAQLPNLHGSLQFRGVSTGITVVTAKDPGNVFTYTQDGGDTWGNSVSRDQSSNPTDLITFNVGEGAAHNNMPPYTQVSIWRRVA